MSGGVHATTSNIILLKGKTQDCAAMSKGVDENQPI